MIVWAVLGVEQRCARWEIPVTDEAPGMVRRRLADVLRRWGMPHLVADAGTVLSELVTNAVQANPTAVTVLVSPFDGTRAVKVSIWDDAPGTPCVREADPGSERGRGLHIVEALSLAWGHRPLPFGAGENGKVVWAVIS